ncbi:hypothetical protein EI94DRAFT_1706143 [Lactarius quietus]|nr:hypothetical protein EI94DRAFT_1706143 [Lactarius quietus]
MPVPMEWAWHKETWTVMERLRGTGRAKPKAEWKFVGASRTDYESGSAAEKFDGGDFAGSRKVPWLKGRLHGGSDWRRVVQQAEGSTSDVVEAGGLGWPLCHGWPSDVHRTKAMVTIRAENNSVLKEKVGSALAIKVWSRPKARNWTSMEGRRAQHWFATGGKKVWYAQQRELKRL